MYNLGGPGVGLAAKLRLRSAGRYPRKAWLSAGAWKTLAGVALFVLAAGGCPPIENVLSNAEGQSIRLSAIDDIVQNRNLTEEQKRQGLRDLGITDDALIELLLLERTGT